MGDIKITFEDLKKTDSLEEHIISKFQKLSKFLSEDYKAQINVKDLTPNKITKNLEYEIVINLKNIEKGKNREYNVVNKENDMYACIDKAIEKMDQQLRKNHERKSDKFKKVKNVIIDRYKSIFQKEAQIPE
ncbi:MAG: ribosome-associated translation inhibitor RaiA [bacterium]